MFLSKRVVWAETNQRQSLCKTTIEFASRLGTTTRMDGEALTELSYTNVWFEGGKIHMRQD